MDIDLELQEKDLFKEMIWDEEVDGIAIWLDGEWSVLSSSHYHERKEIEKPIYILNIKDLFAEIHFSHESIERLIKQIEDMINGRKTASIDYY
jgi:hypothetical protein